MPPRAFGTRFAALTAASESELIAPLTVLERSEVHRKFSLATGSTPIAASRSVARAAHPSRSCGKHCPVAW